MQPNVVTATCDHAWASLPDEQPVVVVYETGDAAPGLMQSTLQALSGEPLTFVVATSRDILDQALPWAHALVTDGPAEVIRAAHQTGVPVVAAGRGASARRAATLPVAARRWDPSTLQRAVRRILTEPRFRLGAEELALGVVPTPPPVERVLRRLTQRGGRPDALAKAG